MYFYTIAMLLHELAHYAVARKLMYRCSSIEISAFGAVLYGEFDDMYPSDRIAVALAGPIVNILLAVLCGAMWWWLPESYYYTELFCMANISMALVNLLPAYPLDGGRVLTALLENKRSHTQSVTVAKNLSFVLGAVLFGVFLVGLVCGYPLFSMGTFALFVTAGAFADSKTTYNRISIATNWRKYTTNGMEKKTIIFDQYTKLYKVLAKMRANFWYSIEIVDDNMSVVGVVDYVQLEYMIKNFSPQCTLRNAYCQMKNKTV